MFGPLYFLVFFVLAVMFCAPLYLSPGGFGGANSPQRQIASLKTLANHMIVQQRTVTVWAAANSGTYGTVPVASLSIPTPWNLDPAIVSEVQVSGPHVLAVTYYNSSRESTAYLVSALNEADQYAGDTGLTTASGLKTPLGTVPLPGDVPVGVPAIAHVLQ